MGLYFTQQITQQQVQLSNKQHQTDLQIAIDQQRETTLKTYLDDMSSLLLDKHLRTSNPDDEVRQVARAKTLTALQRLDSDRKGALTQFLYRAGLIGNNTPCCENPHPAIISLDGADLSKVNLKGAKMAQVDLTGADLEGANLEGASLDTAILFKANLHNADLHKAVLYSANLKDATHGSVIF
jgi:uncharacterized protein YjbI with pentapeptide repeats